MMNELLVRSRRVHIVGIKGSGCAALAEVLHHRGIVLTGSDTPQEFYTSDLLQALGITVYTEFSANHITTEIDLVIHSAAYTPENPEIQQAAEFGIPILSYPQALGLLSKDAHGVAVAGVHGKTTTTAMLGLIVQSQQWSATVVVGSKVTGFNNRATLTLGQRLFIAESCEYREHFMDFYPQAIIFTAIEWDHQDYFKSQTELEHAFLRFALKLPNGGLLVYNADCAGTHRVVSQLLQERIDLNICSFGRDPRADWVICDEKITDNKSYFTLINSADGTKVMDIMLPGSHNVANATSAWVMARQLATQLKLVWQEALALDALRQFRGLSRRLELIGQHLERNILVLDDYAHHPTAIALTLQGLRAFYPNRRLVLSFMSHTYSRTAALFDDFVQALALADVVILHKIYASAREVNNGNVDGRQLYEALKQVKAFNVFYEDEPKNALEMVDDLLQEDDIFVTMGAGDNFELSHQLVSGWH